MLKKAFIAFAMLGIMIPSFAFADSFGLQAASQGTGLINTKAAAPVTVPELIGNIIGIALSFIGAIFFLLTIFAGFLWMTAFGASDKVEKAKDILIHGVMGLAIVLAAYAISKFVFSSLATVSNNSSATASSQTAPLDANTICPKFTTESSCTDPRVVGSNGSPLCFWNGSQGNEACSPL